MTTMKQNMPGKPVKRGDKIWARSDASNGYLYQFEVYTGKKTDSAISEGLGNRVIINITNDLHSTSPLLVVFDNFFTSVPLMETLFSKSIYAIGTIRTGRKFLPELMKKNKKYQKNESLMLACRDTVAVQWRDMKVVTLTSTAHIMNEMTEVSRTQKDGCKKKVTCPKAIADYTRSMGEVDRFNHLKSSYSSSRRSKKWWHRLFYFLLDSSLVNSYILCVHNHNIARNSHLEVRLRIARGLIGGFCNKKRKLQSSWVSMKKVTGIPQEIRTSNVRTHMPGKGETY
ncbi:piggyBac transposable element-derived protein 4 [Caerostris darwini]|uniref:PiggyBac transposable element-derived protein 4 n=1 Tax=Caerostris darwini TaxID=1538125 RepID=A0AAV4SV83_9ARAC|nr:piggyBac transposable element-derived protein 4 [Caerostris darwini]